MTDLFTIGPRARTADPSTSHEAAARAEKFLGAHHKSILAEMGRVGVPLAAEQIGDAIGITHVQVNRRLSELRDLNKVERTEEKHKNRSGSKAYKYRLVESANG